MVVGGRRSMVGGFWEARGGWWVGRLFGLEEVEKGGIDWVRWRDCHVID